MDLAIEAAEGGFQQAERLVRRSDGEAPTAPRFASWIALWT
jgi:hypothetical protein